MVEKDNVIKEKIKHGGLGDLKAAYKYAYGWLENEGYTVIEDEYSEKASGDSKDITIKWTAARKITDYFKILLKLKWKVLGLKDVDVEIDGKKRSMNKYAEIEIEIVGILEKDYSSKWEGSAFNKFIRDIYNKFIIPQRIDQKEDQVKKEVQTFKEEMKAFFDIIGRK
jgi:hypothetical protein